jgi:ribosomal protein S18 acetylase RimI-like enzyme
VHVRDATIDDADALGLVHVHGWQWGYRGLLPGAYLDALSAKRRAEQWRSWLLEPGRTRTWLAEMDGPACAGFIASGPSRDPGADDDTGEIYAIYVEEQAAGTGVAAALLDRAVARLREERFARATLWVLRDNARARRFYEKSAWRADGAAQSVPCEDFVMDEVRYALDLSRETVSPPVRTSSGPT